MVRTTRRRHWIPGRQTLARQEYADTVRQADTPITDDVSIISDATFDRSYGWFDLHRNEYARDTAHPRKVQDR